MTKDDAADAKPLGRSQYFGYAAGDAANNLTFSTVSAFLLIYYTDVAGISAATAGSLFLVVRIWGGVSDLIAGGRLQLGISRGSPEQVIDGWRYFGYAPPEGQTDADMARRHAEVFLELLKGDGFAQPHPQPMFPNPPGLLRLEPHSEGLRERIWWGAATNATAVWAAERGMHLQSSTLKFDEGGEPFHVQQAAQIRAFRAAWKEAGHRREPRVSVSRSIFALMNDMDRAYFGQGGKDEDQIGFIEADTRAIFGRGYAAEPDVLVKELAQDEAIAEADTLLLTVPNQLGVEYNAHVIDSILKHVAPALGWR